MTTPAQPLPAPHPIYGMIPVHFVSGFDFLLLNSSLIYYISTKPIGSKVEWIREFGGPCRGVVQGYFIAVRISISHLIHLLN